MVIPFSHDTYLSPYTWRYGSEEMRRIWSEEHRRRTWRRIWVALSEAQRAVGLVSQEQLAELQQHADQVDIARSHAVEAQIQHDLMAELRVFAEQCPNGGAVLHAGATSSDIKDNADALLIRGALDLVVQRLDAVLRPLADGIERWADLPAMAWTHLQPAEPTTLGYRLAQTAQDLLWDREEVQRVSLGIRGKGFKGAVGTSASFAALLKGTGVQPADLEAVAMASLGLAAFPVTTQTYPRKQDWLVLNALGGIAGTLYKFALDLRVLQSLPFGEWAEPSEQIQVGSSAMPFKRNPVHAETVGSLARLVAALPRVAWDNAAHSVLERTLDDSANRRSLLPEAFLAVDALLVLAKRLISGLRVNRVAMDRNLETFGLFSATEPLLMELVRAGADRQAMHEVIRRHCLEAWAAVEVGKPNPLLYLLTSDPEVLRYLPAERLQDVMSVAGYVGDAPQRAREMATRVRAVIIPQ
jgi:adenylosuccinate lyase